MVTPMELYNNPIDLEAADFIGNPRINLVPGKAEMKGGALVVKSELGLFAYRRGTGNAIRPRA